MIGKLLPGYSGIWSRPSVLLGCSLALFACAPEPEQRDWPRFRGPTGSGVLTEGELPVTWSAEQGVRWKTPLRGQGNSSPVAHDGKVFLTSIEQDKARGGTPTVLAFELATGNPLWTATLEAGISGDLHRYNTHAAPTPAVADAVYVYFGNQLAAFELDGQPRWQRNVDPDYAKYSRYGAASSPVLTREAVIVAQDREWADTEDLGWLAAYDRSTGEQLWRHEWDDACCSYTTPLVVDRGAGEEVIFAHSGSVASYEANTGRRLWSHGVEINQMVSSPVLRDDLLLMAGGAHQVRSIELLRLAGAGGDTQVETLWRSKRFAPQDASPVLYGDKVITVTDQGIAAAHSVESGEEIWHSRLGRGHMRASLIAGDGKVYATSTNGAVIVFSATDEFEILALNELGERGSNASPGIAGGCLLLRTRDHLWCVETTTEESSS